MDLDPEIMTQENWQKNWILKSIFRPLNQGIIEIWKTNFNRARRELSGYVFGSKERMKFDLGISN